MRKLIGMALSLALGMTASAAVPTSAARDLVCSSQQPFFGGTYDNVTVPEGGFCIMVDPRIRGNFQADGAFLAVVTGSDGPGPAFARVGGNVQIKESEVAVISDARVRGNVQLEDNGSLETAITGVRVGGNCQASGNEQPVIVFANTVKGNKEGQCAVDTGPM